MDLRQHSTSIKCASKKNTQIVNTNLSKTRRRPFRAVNCSFLNCRERSTLINLQAASAFLPFEFKRCWFLRWCRSNHNNWGPHGRRPSGPSGRGRGRGKGRGSGRRPSGPSNGRRDWRRAGGRPIACKHAPNIRQVSTFIQIGNSLHIHSISIITSAMKVTSTVDSTIKARLRI